jgi:hypothetical protein
MYFATIRSNELKNQPKGLDDLLLSETENVAAVVDDLLAVSRPSNYFEKFDITFDTRNLYRWFRLSKVEQFYDFHQQAISDHKFIFSGTQYQYNVEKEELTVIVPADARNYARVGDGYFEFVLVPNKYKQLEKQLHQRNKETIKDDYGKALYLGICSKKSFP